MSAAKRMSDQAVQAVITLVIVGPGSIQKELQSRISSQPYAKDILLRTTPYDGDSISVREALHIGVTVVANDNAMRPEGIHLVPSCDRAALHGAIEARLIESSSRQSRDEADEQHLEALLEVYEELMQKEEICHLPRWQQPP